MQTKWCHQCGSEFVARAEVCPDCGIELSVDPPGSPDAESSLADDPETRPGEHVVYELHQWSAEARQHLEQLLLTGVGRVEPDAGTSPAVGEQPVRTSIPHVWQGTDLIVRWDEQAKVDALVDQVELTVMLALDPDADKVAYDLDDLSGTQRYELFGALVSAAIPHSFDDDSDELLVHESDDERVEAIFDAVDFPDALPVDDAAELDDEADDGDDPLAAQEVMSALFVATDRLYKNARDHEGVLQLVDAAESAARLSLPYGFDEADWAAIVDRASDVRRLIEDDDSADDAIEEEASQLRTLLRQYV